MMNRRDVLKSGAAAAAVTAGYAGPAFAAGGPVESVQLTTSTAQFDPVRPEMGRLITQAARQIGFDVQLDAIDYNQGVQKVIMEQDYDLFLVRLTAQSVRIDPDVFIYSLHHPSQHASGRFNWAGYDNPEVTALAEAQRREMDPEVRREHVLRAQELIAVDQPEAVLVYPKMTNAYRSDRLDNMVPQMGEGIGSLWTDVSMTVKEGDGYVRTGATVALKNLNPVAANDANEFKEIRMLYDTLLQVGPDGKVVPWLAESFSLVDPTTIDVSIRQGAMWHDGTPLTVEDVVFSFQYQTEWKAPFFIGSLEKIASVEATGANTVRFTLTEPFAPLFANLFSAMFIIPKHIWSKIPGEADVDDPLNFANAEPVGSGPFTFDYWDRGSELKVSANPNHFMAPKCAGIIRTVFGSHDAMAAAIEKGECDRTRYILKPTLMEDLNAVENVVGQGYDSHGFYCLSYNNTKGPFAHAAVRRAMNHVIPRELIRDIVMSGHAGSGGSVIAPANAAWHNPAIIPASQDLDRARAILAEAGFSWSGDKLMYPAG